MDYRGRLQKETIYPNPNNILKEDV